MGCCQDKDIETSNDEAKEGATEEDRQGNEESDMDSTAHRKPRSEESLLITVLWRRLSMFSRRGSSRSTKRHSDNAQRLESPIPERKHKEDLEQPEKG